jgi:mutator protein MutT
MKLLRQYLKEFFGAFSGGAQQHVQSDLMDRDVQVISQNTGTLGTPQKKLTRAACVVIKGSGEKFLGVSRKHDSTDFGFPGGHIEFGESPEQAAARELEEETGLQARDLQHLVTVDTNDGGSCVVFLCRASGKIHTEEEGVVKWVTANDLLNGSFGKQNAVALQQLNDLYNPKTIG